MENGLKVILEENRTAPVVAIQIWAKVGSADERDEEAGMCHFIEHIIFKGTEKRKVREMAREIESLGGTINAFTSYDQTVYHITIASRYALEVLDAVLSGQGGRLFYELRDKESLAYALAFMANPNLDTGYIGVYMGTHPDKLEKANEGVLRELKRVKEEGLTEEEVERAKRYLIGNFEIGLQTNGAQTNQMSLDELYGLGFDHYQKYFQEIHKVSREDVHQVAKKYFNLEAYSLAIIRPPMEKKE
jgi:predicted Zn-dependent peptidase